MKTVGLLSLVLLLTACAGHERRQDRREDRRDYRAEVQMMQQVATAPASQLLAARSAV